VAFEKLLLCVTDRRCLRCSIIILCSIIVIMIFYLRNQIFV
jgi:hypothetical protein